MVRQMTAKARLVQSGIGLFLADVFVSASDMGHYYCYLLHFIIKTDKIVSFFPVPFSMTRMVKSFGCAAKQKY